MINAEKPKNWSTKWVYTVNQTADNKKEENICDFVPDLTCMCVQNYLYVWCAL